MQTVMQSDSDDSSVYSDDTLQDKIRSSVIDVSDLIQQQSHVTSNNNTAVSHNTHSLRQRAESDEGNVGLDTTAQLREFLARKLVDSLYSKIKFKKSKNREVNVTSETADSCQNGRDNAVWGFRLFSQSNPQTPFNEHYVPPANQKRRNTCIDTSDSDDDEDERFACVAVTADMIRAERDAELAASQSERDAELAASQSESVLHQSDHDLVAASSMTGLQSRDYAAVSSVRGSSVRGSVSSSVWGCVRGSVPSMCEYYMQDTRHHHHHSNDDDDESVTTSTTHTLHSDKLRRSQCDTRVKHKKKKHKS